MLLPIVLFLTSLLVLVEILVRWHVDNLRDIDTHGLHNEVVNLGDDLEGHEVFHHVLDRFGGAHLVPVYDLGQDAAQKLHKRDQEWEHDTEFRLRILHHCVPHHLHRDLYLWQDLEMQQDRAQEPRHIELMVANDWFSTS